MTGGFGIGRARGAGRRRAGRRERARPAGPRRSACRPISFVDHGAVADLRRTCSSTSTASRAGRRRRIAELGIEAPQRRHRGAQRLSASRAPTRRRLDDLVVERGLAEDRDQAARLLMAGQLLVGEGDGRAAIASRASWSAGDRDRSQGGAALRVARRREARRRARGVRHRRRRHACASTWAPRPAASPTVLLRRGAARVYALDVGRGQLADVLRSDPRVVSIERTHAARLDPVARGSRRTARADRPRRHRRLVHLAHARAGAVSRPRSIRSKVRSWRW